MTNKSDDWTIRELDAVLNDIKKGKSRDSEGISRENFHPSDWNKFKKFIVANV